jgi:hypothetical protein
VKKEKIESRCPSKRKRNSSPPLSVNARKKNKKCLLPHMYGPVQECMQFPEALEIFPTKERRVWKRSSRWLGFEVVSTIPARDPELRSLELHLPNLNAKNFDAEKSKRRYICLLYNRLPKPGYLQVGRDKRAKMRRAGQKPHPCHVKSRSENAPMLGWFPH